jgi:hypothetical protein
MLTNSARNRDIILTASEKRVSLAPSNDVVIKTQR